MRNLFATVLNMSMTGSVVILLVIFARLILKRAPKIFSYALWSAVLFRLLCPVAFTAPVSVLNALEPEIRETSEVTSVVYFLPAEAERNPEFAFVPGENQSGTQVEQAEEPRHSAFDIMGAASCTWISGTVLMLGYSIIQYILLRKKLVGAMLYRGDVYLADYVDTPFVMGILRPRIYLPSNIPVKERKYIIAHERHHVRRLDHIIKLLSYLALCIHWFNPLVWIAFVLSGKDMEMSCDEAVIRRMGSQIRADYSASLLRLASHKKIIAGMPLAFGEGDTKGRVMNMAKWKKPKLWVSVICIVLCTAVLVACAVNPEKIGQMGDPNSDGPTSTFTASQDDDSALDSTRMDGPVSVGLGDFYFTLPEGMSIQSAEIVHTGNAWDYGYGFYVGDTTVGGAALRYQEQPNNPDAFSREWQAAIGVAEASDTSMGYMGGGSLYADYEITYFPDIPLNYDDNGNIIMDENGTYVLEHEVTHYFFVNGTDVYDLWLYNNRSAHTLQENLLKTCYIEGVTDIAAMQNSLLEEKEALQQCRSVLEQIQSNGTCKIEIKQENGPFALNETTLRTDWIHGEERLHICLIPESGGASLVGGLFVDGTGYECGSDQQWREINWWDWKDPWLTSFKWDDAVVAYLDTLTDESGTTVMLRIDEPFAEGEDQKPHYFVNFNYDSDGTFRNVYVQTNLFMDNAISKTESVASLDPELIESEIQKEYQKAIG